MPNEDESQTLGKSVKLTALIGVVFLVSKRLPILGPVIEVLRRKGPKDPSSNTVVDDLGDTPLGRLLNQDQSQSPPSFPPPTDADGSNTVYPAGRLPAGGAPGEPAARRVTLRRPDGVLINVPLSGLSPRARARIAAGETGFTVVGRKTGGLYVVMEPMWFRDP